MNKNIVPHNQPRNSLSRVDVSCFLGAEPPQRSDPRMAPGLLQEMMWAKVTTSITVEIIMIIFGITCWFAKKSVGCDSDCVTGKAEEECLHPEHRAHRCGHL